MGRIFIFAGNGGQEDGLIELDSVVRATDVQELVQLQDLVINELRSRGHEVFSVPDSLSLQQGIQWINRHAHPGDIALEICVDAASKAPGSGTTVFYVTHNHDRKHHAELLLLSLLRRVPQLTNCGTKPDIAAELGNLEFCRQVSIPSLVMEIDALADTDDRALIQNQQRTISAGIAEGLAAWSQTLPPDLPSRSLPACTISLNSQTYGEQGIVVNGNACVPVDLVDRLGIDLSGHSLIRRFSYRNVVYIRAIDLRNFYISVVWDSVEHKLTVRSLLPIHPGQIDRITSYGSTTEVQLMMFLKINNESGLKQFPEIARLYREESGIEGINYDIAFSQMCLETNFLRFKRGIKPEQNNFGGLGAGGGASEAVSFPSARLGVRAQIQHLKAYANTEPLVQEVVDPRFQFVTRGIAPLVGQLSGRWSADSRYGDRVIAIVKRLYETSGLL